VWKYGKHPICDRWD